MNVFEGRESGNVIIKKIVELSHICFAFSFLSFFTIGFLYVSSCNFQYIQNRFYLVLIILSALSYACFIIVVFMLLLILVLYKFKP